jgi:undecaprenyl-diphosphatase
MPAADPTSNVPAPQDGPGGPGGRQPGPAMEEMVGQVMDSVVGGVEQMGGAVGGAVGVVVETVTMSRFARLVALDDRLLRRLVQQRKARLTFVFRVLCRLYDPDMVTLAIAAALFSPPLSAVADHAGLALIVTSLLVLVVKRAVRRTRPSLDIQASTPPDRFSFPSGHTAAAFALAIALGAVHPGLVPPMLLLAITVGYARMYLGVHYPLDVAAGAAIGLLCGSVIAIW